MVSGVKNAACGRGSVTDVLGFIGLVFLVLALLMLGFLGVPWLVLVSWNFLATAAGFSALVVPVTWKAIIALALLFAALRLAFWPSRRRNKR